MAPKSTAAVAIILGLTLAVTMAAGMRSPTTFQRQMTALVQPAIQMCKDKSLPDQFWHDLASGAIDHCVKEFADQLNSSFKALEIKDNVEFKEMYEDIQFESLEDCSDRFTGSVRDLIDAVTPIEDLDYLTSAYRIDEDNDENEVAAVVADVVHLSWSLVDREPIRNIDDFKQAYNETGPCSKFYRYLQSVQDYEAYIRFLNLLTVSEFHAKAQWSHMAMVDFLVACEHVQNNDQLLQAAYGYYQNLTNSRPGSEEDEEESDDDLSHDSDDFDDDENDDDDEDEDDDDGIDSQEATTDDDEEFSVHSSDDEGFAVRSFDSGADTVNPDEDADSASRTARRAARRAAWEAAKEAEKKGPNKSNGSNH